MTNNGFEININTDTNTFDANSSKNKKNFKPMRYYCNIQYRRQASANNLNDNDSFENYLENKDETSSTGVASVCNISGWDINDAKKAFRISNIQYAYGDPRNIRSIKKCPFLVDFENQLYKRIFDANEFSVNTFTLNTYGQAYNTPCSYINPTTNIRCNEKPVLKEYKQIDNTTTIRKFIGCQNYQFGQKGHHYIAISYHVNMEYLEQLFQDYTYCSNKLEENNRNKSVNEYIVFKF
ncbi:hypothetical protein C2G38_2224820 [Gigaspora rosea]|uniref:Uncharacterized protein n=1 Tax=Gigaspora rosea TaxID=44941 RepID=A0A397U1I5_9GLOM|nr:hypothetical protein C2G38_2224820 [Gigaspora rosea]